MNREPSPFRMEAAGSLTPALEGAPTSGRHPRNTKAKGQEKAYDGARQEKTQIFLEENKG